MVREEIKSGLKKALEELGVEIVEPKIEEPKDSTHGDYASNVAMIAFGKYKVSSSKYQVFKDPMELANQLVSILNTKYLIPDTAKAEALAPGFLNFWLSKDYLITQLDRVISDDQLSTANADLKGQRIMVEFTDPNPFKEFHIGHLYSNTVGEALSRLFESQGAIVWRANFFGDVGMHAAKCGGR